MINLGTRMWPINLNRFLIEHTIILEIEHIVAVPASLPQNMCYHRVEYADFLIHGKHRLLSMYLTNYQIYTPLLVAFQEYHQYVKNEGIDENILFAKSGGYPMDMVQLEATLR